MMIPQYWRNEYYYNETVGAVNLSSTGAWLLYGANFSHNVTVYEDSIIRVHFHAALTRIGVAGWEWILFRIYQGAVVIGRGAASLTDPALGPYTEVSPRAVVTQNAAAGVVNYQVQFQTSANGKWQKGQHGEFDIAIARD